MSIAAEPRDQCALPDGVTLPATFDIQQVVGVQKLLIESLDARQRLDVDGSAVGRTDGAAMQLLASAAGEARRRRVSFHLNPSDALVEAAAVLGLTELLGCAPATSED